MDRELIHPRKGVALLFSPPFDRTPLDPGYIKGYPPGIRENGLRAHLGSSPSC
ncbi:hypothetical protein ACFQY5_38420 [Paeniroseomonas aquatica]|uniref:Uncharacterized protein n=1 Tax=Paeniroseomonas aquatica TaxID=373043 RepID=A0ABT7ZZW7_9PROT|nr:hypothetical protein [Paeniroseomonas aquatica]MDN3563018.1 hypothetical protein [Paeniroseomonas aquatica]